MYRCTNCGMVIGNVEKEKESVNLEELEKRKEIGGFNSYILTKYKERGRRQLQKTDADELEILVNMKGIKLDDEDKKYLNEEQLKRLKEAEPCYGDMELKNSLVNISSLPGEVIRALKEHDTTHFINSLSEIFPSITHSKEEQDAMANVVHYFIGIDHLYDAIAISFKWYDHLLESQFNKGWICKIKPLFLLSECFHSKNFFNLANRYLMLAFCDDIILKKGEISFENSSSYFQLVWKYGISDKELKEFSKKIWESYKSLEYPDNIFPEYILQDLNQNWMVEYPSPYEKGTYYINKIYARHLISKLGDPTGKVLEKLSEYLLSCMAGCRTRRRQLSKSTDYDIICSMEGFEIDFRSEFGKYFLCECKDWQRPADFTTMAKFSFVLQSVKSRFGILFSKEGLSGSGNTTYGERAQLQIYQNNGIIIIVIDNDDLERVANGENFINILRAKYEIIRLDLLREQS